jgi:transcriptional regulator with XRE-family HTH domain
VPDNISVRADIGRRIKQLRKSKDLSLQKLAEEAGFSAGYLSEVERGNSVLSSEKLSAVARVFGVTADYVLTGRTNAGGATDPDVKIPKALSEFAVSSNLSHEQTMRLLAGHNSLFARRTKEGAEAGEWSVDQWSSFYNRVKDYL